jgi:hypothetical protein
MFLTQNSGRPKYEVQQQSVRTVVFIHIMLNNIFVVRFLLGNSPVSEFYMPTFRNTLSVPSS